VIYNSGIGGRQWLEVEKFSDVNLECVGKARQRIDRDVENSSFDPGNKSPFEVGLVGECLLGEAAFPANRL
jgi:hypothetical protein